MRILAEFKAQLFLLIGTVAVLIAITTYNPQPYIPQIQEAEERTEAQCERAIISWNDYITLFCDYGFTCRKVIHHDSYCIFEVFADYYGDLNSRFECVVSILQSWNEYPDDIRIWVLRKNNTEVVEYIYENGAVERYAR